MGVLLRDNDSLRKALGAVTREKAGLCRAATRLERTLAQHLLKGCTLSVRMRLHRAVAWGSAVRSPASAVSSVLPGGHSCFCSIVLGALLYSKPDASHTLSPVAVASHRSPVALVRTWGVLHFT